MLREKEKRLLGQWTQSRIGEPQSPGTVHLEREETHDPRLAAAVYPSLIVDGDELDRPTRRGQARKLPGRERRAGRDELDRQVSRLCPHPGPQADMRAAMKVIENRESVHSSSYAPGEPSSSSRRFRTPKTGTNRARREAAGFSGAPASAERKSRPG